MILSQPGIRTAIEAGEIKFDQPLQDNQFGEASVDLCLGFSFTVLRDPGGMTFSVADGLQGVGEAGVWKEKILREADEHGKRESYKLIPDDFVLAMTHESITISNKLIARVEGRSTYARVGLSMHQTAPWLQPGREGQLILEIKNAGPLTIELTPLIDRPCQITFFRLSKPLPKSLAYGMKVKDTYQRQKHPLKHAKRN
jgi:dCTP deaminase